MWAPGQGRPMLHSGTRERCTRKHKQCVKMTKAMRVSTSKIWTEDVDGGAGSFGLESGALGGSVLHEGIEHGFARSPSRRADTARRRLARSRSFMFCTVHHLPDASALGHVARAIMAFLANWENMVNLLSTPVARALIGLKVQ